MSRLPPLFGTCSPGRLKASGNASVAIAELTGVPAATVMSLWNRAIESGFDPSARPLVIKAAFLKDTPKSGRPRKNAKPVQKTVAGQLPTVCQAVPQGRPIHLDFDP